MMSNDLQSINAIMALGPVIPVLVIKDAAIAADLATAILAGGIRPLEVTLRTDAALASITAMARVPGAVLGAGTVLTADDAHRAADAGALFLVSPGLSDAVMKAADLLGLPILAGVATATEIMRGLDYGLTRFKFFPAASSGGAAAVAALAGPFSRVVFCPTGGIGPAEAGTYLALPNVACVGGSWIAPRDLVAANDWAAITALARAASTIASSS